MNVPKVTRQSLDLSQLYVAPGRVTSHPSRALPLTRDLEHFPLGLSFCTLNFGELVDYLEKFSTYRSVEG